MRPADRTGGRGFSQIRQYTGQYLDAESGLLFLHARYYDSSSAQFLTRDPAIAMTGTLYAYVRGNPLPSASGTAAYRIPDELNASTLGEVKNVARLSYTNQLRDFATYARTTKRIFNLYVRGSTTFSGPLQDAINAGQINVIRNLPG